MKVSDLIEHLKGKESMEVIIRTPQCRGYRKACVHTARTSDDADAERICVIDLV